MIVTNASSAPIVLPNGYVWTPGQLELPDHMWHGTKDAPGLKNNAGIKVMLEARVILEGKHSVDFGDPFTGLSPEAIEMLMGAETNVDVLKAAAKDHRPEVSKPAKARLKELKSAPPAGE